MASTITGVFTLLCLFVLTVIQAQPATPPTPVCVNTGPLCYNDCSSVTGAPASYQWCGSCQFYLTCVGTVPYYQPCSGNLQWDNGKQTCEAVSNTCLQCNVPTTPSGDSTGVTLAAEPTPAPLLCTSTGPSCINNCGVTTSSGIYQWCGRCDYFIYCSGNQITYQNCQPGLVFDHNTKACNYTSSTCSVCYDGDIYDPCNPTQCKNGATCVDDNPGFTCSCPVGWTGDLCDSVDQCVSIPCKNGGTCQNSGPGFVCSCPVGWTGNLCQSPAYSLDIACGSDLVDANSDPVNNFTKVCYYMASSPADTVRNTPCVDMVQGIPIWIDANGLTNDGGSLGCNVLPNGLASVDSVKLNACNPEFQYTTTLGDQYDYMLVCLKYPY